MKTPDEIMDEAEKASHSGNFKGEIWMSTDGKHTVHGVAETDKDRESMARWVAYTYEKIVSWKGTKQAQAVKEYAKKNGDEDPAAWCEKHKTYMRKYTKEGRSWYSHNVNGEWCTGK